MCNFSLGFWMESEEAEERMEGKKVTVDGSHEVVIDHFSQRMGKLHSDPFQICGCSWSLIYFPNGNNIKNSFSLYLKAVPEEGETDWIRDTNFGFSLAAFGTPSITKSASHKFSSRESEWGFALFIDRDRLQKYIKNDTVTIVVSISLHQEFIVRRFASLSPPLSRHTPSLSVFLEIRDGAVKYLTHSHSVLALLHLWSWSLSSFFNCVSLFSPSCVSTFILGWSTFRFGFALVSLFLSLFVIYFSRAPDRRFISILTHTYTDITFRKMSKNPSSVDGMVWVYNFSIDIWISWEFFDGCQHPSELIHKIRKFATNTILTFSQFFSHVLHFPTPLFPKITQIFSSFKQCMTTLLECTKNHPQDKRKEIDTSQRECVSQNVKKSHKSNP